MVRLFNLVPREGVETYRFSAGFQYFTSGIREILDEPFRLQSQTPRIRLCLGRESNPHGLLHAILSRARIPIPPPRRVLILSTVSLAENQIVINTVSRGIVLKCGYNVMNGGTAFMGMRCFGR